MLGLFAITLPLLRTTFKGLLVTETRHPSVSPIPSSLAIDPFTQPHSLTHIQLRKIAATIAKIQLILLSYPLAIPFHPFHPSSHPLPSPPLHQQTLSTNHIILTTPSPNPHPYSHPHQPNPFPKKKKKKKSPSIENPLLRDIRPRGLLLVSQAVVDRGNDSKVGVMGWDVYIG